MKRTKIICTIGPASNKKTVIEKMIRSGMNVARLNFSHGTYKAHAMLIKGIRDASIKLKTPIAIMQDLQGPRIRVGEINNKMGIKLEKKEDVVLVPDTVVNYPLLLQGPEKVVPIQYYDLYKQVRKGNVILLSDGLIELKVLRTQKPFIYCEVIRPGIIFSHKGINIPSVKIEADVITTKDKEDLKFGIKQDVDWVALSFVKSAKDILQLRSLISKLEGKNKRVRTKIIAKIECKEAVKNFDQILEAVDAIMVARGDLGIELPPEDVPLIQKRIIEKCLEIAKPVIVATQMLDSMIENPRPTRAEVSDVANAVIDHTDAVMLSGETASGKYPVEAVNIMRKIIEETERSPFDDLAERGVKFKKIDISGPVAEAANVLARKLDVKAIIAASASGYTARLISRHRPEHLIAVITIEEKIKRQLTLSWGVQPYVLPVYKTFDELVKKAVIFLKKEKILKKGDYAVIVTGHPLSKRENTNLIKAWRI